MFLPIKSGCTGPVFKLYIHKTYGELLDFLRSQGGRMLCSISDACIRQLPVSALSATGQACAFESIVRPTRTVLVSGLAAGNQLLALCVRQVQRVCCCLVDITCCCPFWGRSQVAQDWLNELIVGWDRHGDFRYGLMVWPCIQGVAWLVLKISCCPTGQLSRRSPSILASHGVKLPVSSNDNRSTHGHQEIRSLLLSLGLL